MDDKSILLEQRDDGLAIVTLNRPEARNAIGQQMIDELHAVLDTLYADQSVGAVILTGAGGKAFAAGADIGLLKQRRQAHAWNRFNQALFARVEELPMPTIAAVIGFALGGGCELSMACDIRIASESARFGQPEVALGIVPGGGGTQRLARLVGIAKAKELIFTGRIIDAAEALALGVANEVVPDDQVMPRALEMAGQILAQSKLAVRLSKIAINAQYEIGPAPGYALEYVGQAILFEDEEKERRMGDFLDRQAQKRAAREAKKDA